MKKFCNILCLLCIFLLLPSCHEDEVSSGSDIGIISALVGVAWDSDPSYDFSVYDDGFNLTGDKFTLYFNDDKTGIVKQNRKKVDDVSGYSRTETPHYMSYFVDGKNIRITINGNKSHMTFDCELQGDYLVDVNTGNPVYHRRAITAADQEWLEKNKYRFTDDWKNISVSYNAFTSTNYLVYNDLKYEKRVYWPIYIDFAVLAEEKAYTKGVGTMEVEYFFDYDSEAKIFHSTTQKSFKFDFTNDAQRSHQTELLVTGESAKIRATVTVTNRFSNTKESFTLDNIASFDKPDYVKKFERENGFSSEDNTGGGSDEGTGTGDNGGGNTGGGTTTPTVDWRAPYCYTHDGREFKMQLVEGGSSGSFYMMQTEVCPQREIIICGQSFGPLDSNSDNVVTLNEFKRFLQQLRDATGLNFRLPTREEWQYAANGGKYSKGYTYAGGNAIDAVAWYSGNASSLKSIGKLASNELGLYDMSGNYAEATYEVGKEDGIDGDLCGGSYKDDAAHCKWNSWVAGNKSTAYIENTRMRHQNAINAKYETVRLIFTK